MVSVQFSNFTKAVNQPDFFDAGGQNRRPSTGSMSARGSVSGCCLQNDGSEIIKGKPMPRQDFVDVIQAGTWLQTDAAPVLIHF